MQGVGGSVMEAKFAIQLRLEFVGLDKRQGAPENPSEIFTYKVFPKGESNIVGLFLGFPVLDREPFGFEFSNMDTCWYFKKIDVQMPKAEMHDRARYKKAASQWRLEPQIGGRPSGPESMRAGLSSLLLKTIAVSSEPLQELIIANVYLKLIDQVVSLEVRIVNQVAYLTVLTSLTEAIAESKFTMPLIRRTL